MLWKRGGVRSSFDTSCHEASVQHQVTNVLVFCEKWKWKRNLIFIPVFFFLNIWTCFVKLNLMYLWNLMGTEMTKVNEGETDVFKKVKEVQRRRHLENIIFMFIFFFFINIRTCLSHKRWNGCLYEVQTGTQCLFGFLNFLTKNLI